MASVDAAGGPEADGALDVPLPGIKADLVSDTERCLIVSYLLGMYHASPEGKIALADDDPVPAISFDEAAKYMKTRIPMTKKEWSELEPKLRFRAFTVAALSTPDAIEKANGMVTSAIEEGKSKAEFWKDTRAFEAAGLSNAAPFYWENVYRTNIQTAYNTGRAAEYMRENPEYLEFVGIDDGRQSEICYALTHPAIVLPATHPFWKTHWPPLHFRCRSTTRGLYPEEVEALREADPAWGATDLEGVEIPETASSFGENPLDSESFWKMTPSMKERAKEYGLLDTIEAYAKSLGLPLDGITLPAVEKVAETESLKKVPTFATVRQAEKWVKGRLADECSFKGCDVDLVQAVVERLNDNLEKYPEAREKLEFVGTIQGRNRNTQKGVSDYYFKRYSEAGVPEETARKYAEAQAKKYIAKFKASPGTIAEYMHSNAGWKANGITINEKVRRLDILKNVVEQNGKSGWFPKMPTDPGSVIDHEMGHLLDDVYKVSESPEFKSLVQGLTREQVAGGLSKYAATSPREFVAEAWAEYTNSPKPRDLAKSLGELIMKRRAR